MVNQLIKYIKVFKRKISDSMDRALLLGEFNGRFSFVFPQENANSIIFGIRDINHNTTIVYKYSSGTFSKSAKIGRASCRERV